MGEDLLCGNMRYIAGVANLRGVHWISFLIDGLKWQILIGDSLIRQGTNRLLKSGKYDNRISTLHLWIKEAAGPKGLKLPPFECEALPINQQTDTDSCGIFACNSLRHFIMHDWIPLVQASTIAQARLCLASKILKCHSVCSQCSVNMGVGPLLLRYHTLDLTMQKVLRFTPEWRCNRLR